MSQSLSIIMPVYNAEAGLGRRVNELLEVVADLTDDIELLIVDNGSTDGTEEVAMELEREIPQVRILRRSEDGGWASAREGIRHSFGDVILIHDLESALSPNAIREFWAMRDDEELVYARAEPAHVVSPKMRTSSPQDSPQGTQMLRRTALSQLRDEPEAEAKPPASAIKIERVTRTDLGAKGSSIPSTILQQLTEGKSTASESSVSTSGSD